MAHDYWTAGAQIEALREQLRLCNIDQCNAEARLAEAEALLRDINAADRHLTDGAWWVVLYQDHYDRIDAFLTPADRETGRE